MEKTTTIHPQRGSFETTHWTVVLAAAGQDSAQARTAFGRLYGDYWYPLYAFARRRGASPEEAQDLAQEFFTRLLEKQSLEGIQREGGKFRSFLLRSFDNFLIKERERRNALKRGGGIPALSLQMEDAEARYTLDPADAATPESHYERLWALTLLDHVLQRLRGEWMASGREAFFLDMQPHLQGEKSGLPYAEIAERHGMTESAVKVAVHRVRVRYGELLRQEIGRTVSTAAEVEDELRHLITVMGR